MVACKGDLNILYKITKQLHVRSQSDTYTKPVKDTQEKLIQAARCFQHFEEALNRPELDQPVDPEPSDNIAINTGPPGFPSRSRENNQGNEELVKICLVRFGNTCTVMYEVIPKDRSKGLVFKLLGKGASAIILSVTNGEV